jgi:hypothetical protein
MLGLAGAVSAFAQGHIVVSNYANSPYAQIIWGNGANVGQAITSAANLTFQVFYGSGIVGSFAGLTAGSTFQIDNTITTAYDPGVGAGAGGYFINVDQVFPWSSGNETLAYEVTTPGYTGQSALWVESANIALTTAPGNASQSVGLTVSAVPEPTTMLLAGLGAASLLIFRKRQ